MTISIVADKIKLDDRFRTKVVNKFTLALNKHLQNVAEDLKNATVNIQKLRKGDYEVRFDMNLPFVHVYAKETHKNLLTCVLQVRDEARRILRKNLEKLRDQNH